MIKGIGTDIVEIERIRSMIERHGDHFLQRCYTSVEIEYAMRHRDSAVRFAGRWAAKEAVVKVLGTGWSKGIHWTDLEVINEISGAPKLILSGRAAEIAKERGIREVMLSISHCRSYATALATGVS